MAVTVDKDVWCPPDHLRAIESHMVSYPGDWRVAWGRPETLTYTLIEIEQENEDKAFLAKCTIQLDTEPLWDMNHEDHVNSLNRRFPDEVCVARIPEHLLYSEEAGNIGTAVAEGDWNHVRKILDDSDFQRFRSFRGRMGRK